ncbi:hypothetical protein [Brevibacillus reuszeri]|uniref:hypothetical protein n=1 Tax=Brevibacillus reuszeri TaxID=54915 RepID=UPI003D25C820
MMFAQRMKQGMELSGESFHKVAHLFASLSHHLSIRGVITGVLPGRVFLAHDGTAAILTSPQGIFFGGSSDNKLFLNEAALGFAAQGRAVATAGYRGAAGLCLVLSTGRIMGNST